MQRAEYVGAPPGALAIPLKAKGGGVRAWTLVDEADYAWASQYNWALSPSGYARRNASIGDGQRKQIMLHRVLLGLGRRGDDPRWVDHINRNKLDNRRCNLRAIEPRRNSDNQGCNKRANRSSKYRGVSFHKRLGKWMAYCRLDYKLHHLGYFKTEEEAAVAASEFRAKHTPLSEDAA